MVLVSRPSPACNSTTFRGQHTAVTCKEVCLNCGTALLEEHSQSPNGPCEQAFPCMQQHIVQGTAHCSNMQGVVMKLQALHCLKNTAAGLMVRVSQLDSACQQHHTQLTAHCGVQDDVTELRGEHRLRLKQTATCSSFRAGLPLPATGTSSAQ